MILINGVDFAVFPLILMLIVITTGVNVVFAIVTTDVDDIIPKTINP